MRGPVAAVVLALAVAGIPTPVHASEPDATELRDQAAQAYVEGRYADASELYRVAFQKDHDAWLLYARAAAEHRGRNYENAIALYSWYVATDPPQDKRKAAESNIAVCQLELVSRAEGKPRPRVEAPTLLADPWQEEPEPPLALNPWGLSLAVVAGTGFIAGAALGITARGTVGQANRAPTAAQFERNQQRAANLAAATTTVVVLAAAATIGSAVAYHVAAKKRREGRVALSPGGVRLRF